MSIQKISSFIFFFSFVVICFVFGQKVQAETCNGLTVVAGSGRCGQASQKLGEFITCLASKDSTLAITSIGDDPDIFNTCVDNWTDNPCNHDDASCHYGGVKADGTRDCTDGSHAVDIRANSATKEAIINKVTACGGRGFFENDNHVHASVSGCGCDGWPAGSSIAGIPYTPKPICFVPQISIPGLQLGDANAAECPGGVILNSKGDAIALYVSALYRYAAGLAGVIAMFMIVFASWQWIMASGNAGKIDNAKDTIRGALLGLTLLFTGNLLLSNITDNLVNFQSLSLQSIEGNSFNLSRQSINPVDPCSRVPSAQACEAYDFCALGELKIFTKPDGSEVYAGKCIGYCAASQPQTVACNQVFQIGLAGARYPTVNGGPIADKPQNYLEYPNTMILKTQITCRGAQSCSSQEQCLVKDDSQYKCLYGNLECACIASE